MKSGSVVLIALLGLIAIQSFRAEEDYGSDEGAVVSKLYFDYCGIFIVRIKY